MKKAYPFLRLIFICLGVNYLMAHTKIENSAKKVHNFQLDNGLKLLVVPMKHVSQVSAQIWYNVGSKHEVVGERGMAHFIEHMVFKGTEEMLSESDINMLGDKLSAYTNAGTWYDFTFYYFTLPLSNWDKVLPVFADCMQHCRFKQDHMDSEVKAVIQELKMSNDNYSRFLTLKMASAIFDSHPYHYTTIGFKQDLWNLKRETLVNFYKKHYTPQNATIVVVGDVNPQDVLLKVKNHFNDIPRGKDLPKDSFYFNEDIQTKSVTLHRDVQQSIGKLAFVVPGQQEKTVVLYEILGNLLANTKSSRLYKKLVDELGLVSGIMAHELGTFEKELYQITFYPKNEDDFDKVRDLILQEINDIAVNGITEDELSRALKITKVEKQLELEDVQSVAQNLGWAYLATGDEELIFENIESYRETLKEKIVAMVQQYFRPSLCHQGRVVKLSESDKQYFENLQKEAAESDGAALTALERESKVEPGKYVHTVTTEQYQKKEFVEPEVFNLSNGLEVVLCHNDAVDIVDCSIALKADRYYDSNANPGLYQLVAKMMTEGTKKYPGLTFAQTAEKHGVSLQVVPGEVSCCMLSSDTAVGLDFMQSILTESLFDKKDFERVKDKQKTVIKAFWDEPKNIASHEARSLLYNNHPYGKNLIGTPESLDRITRDNCYDFYKKYSSPKEARLVVSGNFDRTTIKNDIQKAFAHWGGPGINDLDYPAITNQSSQLKLIEKNRDQVFLAFVGLSVDRFDPSYDALVIYDQLLAGTSMSNMDTLLFRLREQTGLFYTAGGSIVAGADKQPGMIYIVTMVAKDRVQEAHAAFVKIFKTSIDNITDNDFKQAQESIVTSFARRYETNSARASVFHFLRKFNLPFNYFENRVDTIRNITKEQMVKAVKDLFDKQELSFIRVGKVLDNKTTDAK